MKYRIAVPKIKSRFRILYRALKCMFTGKLILEIGINQSMKSSDSTFTSEDYSDFSRVQRTLDDFDLKMMKAFNKPFFNKDNK